MIYPASAKYTTTNGAFNSSLYQLADPSTVYVSVDEGIGILFALQKFREDIKNKKLQGKACINISGKFESATWRTTDNMKISMNETVKGVTKLDALIFIAAGNNGQPT